MTIIDTKSDIGSIGISFLDKYMGGGDEPGEVMGLLGGFGTGKTTIGVMIAVEAAKRYYTVIDNTRTVSFLISYDERIQSMRSRVLSYGAIIHRKSLETMRSLDDLSRTTSLRPYESYLFSQQLKLHGQVDGERERAEKLLPIVNNHLVLVDMTGEDGTGGPAAIAARIRSECERRKCVAGRVVIDGVSAMVKRQIDADDDLGIADTRQLMADIPLHCRSKIAVAFGSPVWLLNGLSGEANRLLPSSLPHSTDAVATKVWAETLDFNFCIGLQTDEQFALFGCDKHRRSSSQALSILKHEGAFNRLRNVSADYVFDAAARTITKKPDTKG